MKTIGVILASGVGDRAGSYIPKQFVKVNGKPIYRYVIDAFREAGIPYLIMIPPDHLIQPVLSSDVYAIGGATRTETIKKSFPVLQEMGAECVVYHDAARPLISARDILSIVEKIEEGDAWAFYGPKITDSLIAITGLARGPVDREDYRLVQTPEAFRFDKLLKAYSKDVGEPTFIAAPLVGYEPGTVVSLPGNNFKITYPEDFRTIEKMLTADESFPNEVVDFSALTGKKCLVLGGSGGIGSCIVKGLEEYTDRVRAPSRTLLDLATDDWRIAPGYDHIIHAAGMCYSDIGIAFSERDMMFRVNTFSVDFLLRRSSQIINPGGSVLIIGSSSSTMGRTGFGLYSASKSSANALVQANAARLFANGIRANCLCPTKTRTKMAEKTMTPADIQYLLEPEYVASAAIKSLLLPYHGKIWYLYKGLDV